MRNNERPCYHGKSEFIDSSGKFRKSTMSHAAVKTTFNLLLILVNKETVAKHCASVSKIIKNEMSMQCSTAEMQARLKAATSKTESCQLLSILVNTWGCL